MPTMVLELLGGAVLGVVLDRQCTALSRAIKMATGLGSRIKKVDNELRSAELRFSTLDHPERVRFTRILDDGEQLILKCSNISQYNLWKKWRYARRVKKLENFLADNLEILAHIDRSSTRSGSRLFSVSVGATGAAARAAIIFTVVLGANYLWR